MTSSAQPDRAGNDPATTLTRLFADRLARVAPHFGGGGPDYFGVRLENVAPDGSELDLVLTFRSGERYCCIQPGCHLGVGDERFWPEIRAAMDDLGMGDRPLPTIRVVRVEVEEGALVDLGGIPRKQAAMVYEKGPFRPDDNPDR